jgi:hypothetical protein
VGPPRLCTPPLQLLALQGHNRTTLARYLFPLARTYNPNSKGVIYVSGRVALSGVLNSKLTVAASQPILIADDLADNAMNAPWDYTGGTAATGSGVVRNYKASNDETLQAVLMTLASFTVENYGSGSGTGQPCGTTTWGRGCLYLTGGIIQEQRGAVGTTGGTGYVKRYAYDVCAYQTPPPYFPTTGRYARNRYYEIDPVGFSVSGFFASLTP